VGLSDLLKRPEYREKGKWDHLLNFFGFETYREENNYDEWLEPVGLDEVAWPLLPVKPEESSLREVMEIYDDMKSDEIYLISEDYEGADTLRLTGREIRDRCRELSEMNGNEYFETSKRVIDRADIPEREKVSILKFDSDIVDFNRKRNRKMMGAETEELEMILDD
jgi:hypothetical protein